MGPEASGLVVGGGDGYGGFGFWHSAMQRVVVVWCGCDYEYDSVWVKRGDSG